MIARGQVFWISDNHHGCNFIGAARILATWNENMARPTRPYNTSVAAGKGSAHTTMTNLGINKLCDMVPK